MSNFYSNDTREYEKWSSSEDLDLWYGYINGISKNDLAVIHGRSIGAIRSRLKKLLRDKEIL